jgi:hypothetical protein
MRLEGLGKLKKKIYDVIWICRNIIFKNFQVELQVSSLKLTLKN